jgi:hypothetical protein
MSSSSASSSSSQTTAASGDKITFGENDASAKQLYQYTDAEPTQIPRFDEWEAKHEREVATGAVDATAQQAPAVDDAFKQRRRDVFALFDYNVTGTIATEDLGTVLRALDRNPTEREVQRLVNLYDNDGVGTLDYPEFCRIVDENQP